MGEHRAVGTGGDVIDHPGTGVDAGPGAVELAVGLADGQNKGHSRHQRQNVGQLAKYQQIHYQKCGSINANQPTGNGLAFPLIEKVVDNGLYGTDAGGNSTVISAGQDIAACHQCVGGANQINSIKPGAGSDCEYTGNGDGKTSWTYTSTTYFNAYAFKISAFLDAWTDGDIDTATAKVQLAAKATGAGTYYIAGIYAAKEISNASLGVTINGESSETASVKAGDVISLEMYNPELYPYIDMTVKAPDGQVITNLSSITAVAGTYTITFKHNPIGATDADKGYYFLRHDYGGCYSRGGATKTITFIVS